MTKRTRLGLWGVQKGCNSESSVACGACKRGAVYRDNRCVIRRKVRMWV